MIFKIFSGFSLDFMDFSLFSLPFNDFHCLLRIFNDFHNFIFISRTLKIFKTFRIFTVFFFPPEFVTYASMYDPSFLFTLYCEIVLMQWATHVLPTTLHGYYQYPAFPFISLSFSHSLSLFLSLTFTQLAIL